MRPSPHIAAAFLLALSACGEASGPPRAPIHARGAGAAKPSAAERPSRLFVWARPKDDGERREAEPSTATTFQVSPAGEILDRAPGIRIATSRGELAWTTRRVEVKTDACDLDVPIPPQESWATSATLVGPGGESREVVRARTEAEGANEVHHTVDLLASLGPYLFVEESTWTYACGAHGAESKTFVVWDASQSRRFDVIARLPDPAAVVASARKDLTDGITDGAFTTVPPEITEVLPVYRAGGTAFEAVVTFASCYACGDGIWASYTRSKRVPITPPAELAKVAVPAAVAIFAREHPDLVVGGWSVSTPKP